jgi:hypothetical protein
MNCQAQPPYGPLSSRNKARESTAVQRTLREITRPFFQRSRSTKKGEPSETLLVFLPPSSRPPVTFLSPSYTLFDTGSCLDQETTLVAHQGAQIVRPLPAELPKAYFVIFPQRQEVEGSSLQARVVQRFEFNLVGPLIQVVVRVEKGISRCEVHTDSAG